MRGLDRGCNADDGAAILVLMNDSRYVKRHMSGALGNAFLALLTVFAALLALVVIPLEVLGG
jgi:hypothetical protein